MGGHECVVFSLASVANGAKMNMVYNPQGLTRIMQQEKTVVVARRFFG